MRWSQTLLTTLRDDPQEAEIPSHRLMLRAGLIRRVAGGIYTFMPHGLRALRKVEAIIREEMDRAGAQEILMPALQPAELWSRSGRLGAMGPTMFTVRDRQDRTLVLGPTHEEVVTDLATREIDSYRQLPCTLYQIQVKFRDEIRPRFGLMRAKEFIMKDAYSFDFGSDAAEKSYQAMYRAYERIFKRCGLRVKVVEADSGDMGGSASHEFMVLADTGEDGLVECHACGYAANRERAERRVDEPDGHTCACPPVEPIATPGASTIADVTALLHCEPADLVKTLIYRRDGEPVAVLVPGDRDVNEPKLKHALGAQTLTLAEPDGIAAATGAPVGFAGPIGLQIPVVADLSLKERHDVITGANRDATHLRHVCVARDVQPSAFADLTIVGEGDGCPRCGVALHAKRGIEVGHVFKLGTKYTEAFKGTFLDENGDTQTMIMGCYGIGVTRTLQSVIEQTYDADGIRWPDSVAPFVVNLLLLDPEHPACCEIAGQLERNLADAGLDVFVDDRKERPGVKFKDADLLGYPFRVVVGAKSLAKGGVEIKRRGEKDTQTVPPEAAVRILSEQYRARLDQGDPVDPS